MVRSVAGHRLCACVTLSILSFAAQFPPPTPTANTDPKFDGKFRASHTKGVEEAYLSTLFPISHAANLVKLRNGDLLCFWFSGTGEGESNVAIVMSRLAKGAAEWSKPVEIDHQAGKSFQNPVAFEAPDGRLWLVHTSQPAGEGQRNAEVLYLTSDNGGQAWTKPRPLFAQPGSFVRQPPVLLNKEEWLLPMYYTPTRGITDGAESHYSAMKITRDGGKSWKECTVPQSNGLVQPSVLRLANRHFLGFFRSRYADFIYKSTSQNGCDWTAPAPTRLPNNNSSIQAVLLRDGSVAIAFNNSNAGVSRYKTRTSVRTPLSIALSPDGGDTWPWVRDIETGTQPPRAHEEYSYPSLLQTGGKVFVAYSFCRDTIKVVRFDPQWIKEGETAGKFKGDKPQS